MNSVLIINVSVIIIEHSTRGPFLLLNKFMGLRHFLSGPFPFHDHSMELRFRADFVSTCLVRNKSIICNFYLPFIASMRISWFIYWILYPYKLTTVEVVVSILRVLVLCFVGMVTIRTWHDTVMTKFGHILLWLSRMLLILLFAQQFSADHNDNQTMIAIATILCCTGLVIPSFTEYLCFALTLPYLRPLMIYLASNDGLQSQHLQEVLFQHSLLLALAISVTGTIHSDCRHKWLCSSARSALPPAGPQARTTCTLGLAGPARSEDPEYDVLADGYFTDAERAEMRPQVIPVRPPDRLAGRTAGQ